MVGFLAIFSGCGTKAPSLRQLAVPYAGTTVRVSCPGDPSAAVVARYGQSWAAEAAAKIEIVRYDLNAGPELGPPADVWIIPPASMPRWANAGKLHAVPQEYTSASGKYAWGNLLSLYKNKLLVWDRKAWALPILGDATLCFYRDDIFRDPLHREAFKKKSGYDLTPPATWQQFADIAEYFHGQPRNGSPCRSLPPLPEDDDGLDREFYSVVVPLARRAAREDDPRSPPSAETFSFHYDLDTSQPRIATTGFIRALELLQRLQPFRSTETTAEPPAHFQRGEAVLCLASPAWISRFQANPNLHGKFGICRVPGSSCIYDYRTGEEVRAIGSNRVPYLGAGGWLAVVPASCPQPEAAFALIASLSEPKTSRDVVVEPAWGGGVFRRDHLINAGWEAFGLDRKQTEGLVDILKETITHPQVKNPVLRLRTPDAREHQQALMAEIRVALLEGKGAAQALEDAAKRWREIDWEKNPQTRKAEYRLSLSLDRN
jgi:multiple sugar transport system substrate-binding protein